MVDFRKLISPRSNAVLAARLEAILKFQAMDKISMASSILDMSRMLIDSGKFSTDHNHSYDEWALYRVIPELAKRLDPNVKLRQDEIAAPAERVNESTWIHDGDDEAMIDAIRTISKHGSFRRAWGPEGPTHEADNVEIAAELLFDGSVNMVKIATDIAHPGSFPGRRVPDERASLPGQYCILETSGFRYSVLAYSEDTGLVDRYFAAVIDMIEGREVLDENLEISIKIRRPHDVGGIKSVTIQLFDGEVLRSWAPEVECEEEIESENEPSESLAF